MNHINLFLTYHKDKTSNKHVAPQNLSIYYMWKNSGKKYKNSKLRILAPKWNGEFELQTSKTMKLFGSTKKINSQNKKWRKYTKSRLVFSWVIYICGNLRNVKEKTTRKTCFSHEIKHLALRIYLAKFCQAAFL